MHPESGRDLNRSAPSPHPPHNNQPRQTVKQSSIRENHRSSKWGTLTSRVTQWSRHRRKTHDCSCFLKSRSLFVSLSWSRQELGVIGGAERSSFQHVSQTEGLWSSADPGPSAHTLPSEDEKRRLHYQHKPRLHPSWSPSSFSFSTTSWFPFHAPRQ